MANSNNIQILNSEISTGDDCASMGPGSQNVNISSNVKIWPSNVESALAALVEPQTKKKSVKLQCKIVTSKGTSSTKVAVDFQCSKVKPRDKIELRDIY
ncbi:hypothetical protein CUMW_159770 [Citrus unshiu]|nr:hypothetical protein CUMW_159770 [Citrus unshiu]